MFLSGQNDMGTLVDTDIDSFIRGHKAKLQDERTKINQYTVCIS